MIRAMTSDGEEICKSICDLAFKVLELEGDAVIEVSYLSKDAIRTLNNETRDVDKATDVLSYPMLDSIEPFTKDNYPYDYDDEINAVVLGSIVICNDIAQEQAKEYGHTEGRENSYLFTHGLLHLLGYDHESDNDKDEMRRIEEKILMTIGQER